MSVATKIQQINDSMDRSVSAQQARDYVSARDHAETAYLLIAGLPQKVALENEELEWSASGIKEALDYLKGRIASTETSSGGSIMRPVPVTYDREGRYSR